MMRCMLLRMLEAVEGVCLREVREVLEAMRRVLLCMLEAVEGELCLLEVPGSWRRCVACYLVCWR